MRRVLPPRYLLMFCLVWASLAGPAATAPIEPSNGDVPPPVHLPAYRGLAWVQPVPDTLDVADMARLTINALTGLADPQADGEIYWATTFACQPPIMSHDWNDWVQVKFVEALPLLRVASGSVQNLAVEQAWVRAVLRAVGPDGLLYISLDESKRPWARLNSHIAPGTEDAAAGGQRVSQTAQQEVTACFYNARLLAALTVYYQLTGWEPYRACGQAVVDRLADLAIPRNDYVYFPAGVWGPDAAFAPDTPMPVGLSAEENGGRAIQGLAQFYRVTGYEPARSLAGKLVRYLRYHARYYDSETGAFIPDPQRLRDFGGPHFHAHTIGLLSMLDYALAAEDDELQQFCARSFAWARQQGDTLTGFFPENIGPQGMTAESCEVADMIAIALKLSQAGIVDCWDDAENWTRNQFATSQLVDIDWIAPCAAQHPPRDPADNETTEDVARRNQGAFASWATGNEFGTGIMHCCTGNAARTVYYIWQAILAEDERETAVNLLLNRVGRTVDVLSWLPSEGRIEVLVKQPRTRLGVRLPTWVTDAPDTLTIKIDGSPTPYTWDNRYVVFNHLPAGARVVVTFPVPHRSVQATLGHREYTLHLQGNTVVEIEPAGRHGALYDRPQYRAGPANFVERPRFVAEKAITW